MVLILYYISLIFHLGLWTSIYLASQSFKYAITKDAEDKKAAWARFEVCLFFLLFFHFFFFFLTILIILYYNYHFTTIFSFIFFIICLILIIL